MDEAQAAAMSGRGRELLRGRGEEADAHMVGRRESPMPLHVFAIESLDAPLDASLFQEPA